MLSRINTLNKFINKSLIAKSMQSLRFYDDLVIEHYEHPRNVGSLNKKEKNVGTGVVGAPACGDVMKLQVFIVYNEID